MSFPRRTCTITWWAFGTRRPARLHCYVNGELKKSVDCAGIKHMTTSSSRARAFAIGGNTQSNTQLNGAWNGDIAIARIYDDVLSADDVKALYEDVRE